jgi:hypothetical protein
MRNPRLVTSGACIIIALATTVVRAEIKIEAVDYRIGTSELEGFTSLMIPVSKVSRLQL